MRHGKIRGNFLFNHRERWGLTPWGLLLLIILLFFIITLIFRNIYPTLAPIEREKSDVLVLEGFATDHVMKLAMKEFTAGKYRLLVVTGAPLEYGDMLSAYHNTATVAGKSLLKMGFDSTRLVIVTTADLRNERTYNSAVSLRQWMVTSKPDIRSLNLITTAVHGGRSRLLFRKALGDSIRVGIISVPGLYYGASDWLKTSKGFRETMNEAIGYFYIRWFFRPGTR